MATITPGAVTPISAAYSPTPAYSGTFIPTMWSGKMNVKFYNASTFADICNRNWEGEIKNMGDKVIINNVPNVMVNDYVVGQNLIYQTPAPNTIEMVVDRAKYFGFNVHDVIEYQSKPDMMDTFSTEAAQTMRTVLDSTCIYRTFNQGAAQNRGANAGLKSGIIDLGTDAAPMQLTTGNVLTKILELAAVLDEQNVPDDRWLLIDPLTRTLLLQTALGQAYVTGDATSPIRNGLIGKIDRFRVYVTNHLPTAAANGTAWISGDGSETSVVATTNANRRRIILAGHNSAISFATQMTKTESLQNPTDFGKIVRGLQVFGHKVTKPESLAMMVAR